MLCTLIGVLSACNEYDFDQEQYRNEVGLLSNSSLIYDRQVANVGQEKDTIYLVATVSGSQISPNTHHVALLESDSLLKAYNKSNFDIEKRKNLPNCFPMNAMIFPIRNWIFRQALPK